jgi:hypothetical protein
MKVANIKVYESLSREAYVFRAEGRIGMKKLIVAFRNFGNAYIQGVPGGMCETSGECSLC